MKQRYASTNRPYITIDNRPVSPRITAQDRLNLEAMKYLGMSMLLALGIVITAAVSHAAEPLSGHKYCNPKVSKPCGNGCVLLAKACHIPWTTSISGVKPAGAQASIVPKYVETAPKE